MDYIYTYDSSILDTKSSSGKYFVSILVRGNTKYSSLTNDLTAGLKMVFNRLCFDNRSKEIFITLSNHINPDWIVIKFNNDDLLLHIKDINQNRKLSIDALIKLLDSKL